VEDAINKGSQPRSEGAACEAGYLGGSPLIPSYEERMGLLVVGCTLRADRNRRGVLENIRGAVWVEVTDRCILQPDVIEEICELLATNQAFQHFEREVTITSWKVSREGSRVSVEAGSWDDHNADSGPSCMCHEKCRC